MSPTFGRNLDEDRAPEGTVRCGYGFFGCRKTGKHSHNAHGLEPSPSRAFLSMEARERQAYRTRTAALNRLRSLELRRTRQIAAVRETENQLGALRTKIKEINSSVPEFGRQIR